MGQREVKKELIDQSSNVNDVATVAKHPEIRGSAQISPRAGTAPISEAQGCEGMQLWGSVQPFGQNIQELMLHFILPQSCNDVINIMWATPGGSWQQVEFDPHNDDNYGWCIPNSRDCTYRIGYRINANLDKSYLFKIQSCRTRSLGSSVCGPWSGVFHYLPYGPDTCQDGYVWREASPNDHVCVVPGSRDEARQDNALAASRVNQTDHTYGPDTCILGYVWREAFPNDHVCVPPDIRTRIQNENTDAWKHFARNFG